MHVRPDSSPCCQVVKPLKRRKSVVWEVCIVKAAYKRRACTDQQVNDSSLADITAKHPDKDLLIQTQLKSLTVL